MAKTLRGRVAWFVTLVIVAPLLAGALLLQRGAQAAQTDAPAEVARSMDDALDRLEVIRARVADEAELIAERNAAAQVAADRPNSAAKWLREQLAIPGSAERTDFAVIVRRDRTPLAMAVGEGAGAPPVTAEQVAAAVTEGHLPGLVTHTRALWPAGQFVGWLVTGRRVDADLLGELPARNVALLERGRVVATTQPLPSGLSVPVAGRGTRGDVRVAGGRAVSVAEVGPQRRLLVWLPTGGPGPLVVAWAVLVLWALAAIWLSLRAVRAAVADPVRRASTVARQAADGDLDQRVVPHGAAELRELGRALNDMSTELDRRLRELGDSRDQLRGALARLGETLSSSLNLDRTLAVATDTAMDTVQADRAMLVLTTDTDDLEVKIDRGFDLGEDARFEERSLPGWVVRTGLSVRLPADRVVISPAVDGGILATHQLSVPVTGTASGGCIGALLLARSERGPAFTEDDLRTVRTFAGQAGVAIENVLLHQEARRLSLTDPLTELWNFRYFQLQALREVEAASRYNRPLGLLIVDLDHFKRINDRHGHPVGDQVLAEVARRIRTSTRLPDIVARYGGEEFVLLLPGTDAAGAVVTAERIRQRLARLPIVAGGQDVLRISVTCSVGVAAFPIHGTSVDELLRRADAALYTAKSQGRDRVVNAEDVGAEIRVPPGRRDRPVGAR